MDGIFIVSKANVLLYKHHNKELKNKFIQLAIENGLIEEPASKTTVELDNNVILQILNPILVSQKMMFSQFDNNYSSLVAIDNFNIAYEEYFGNLFVRLSSIHTNDVQTELLRTYVYYTRMLYGPYLAAINEQFLNGLFDVLLWNQLNDYAHQLDGAKCSLERPEALAVLLRELGNELKVSNEVLGNRYHALLICRDQLVGCFTAEGMAATGNCLQPGDVTGLCRLANSRCPKSDDIQVEVLNVYLSGGGGGSNSSSSNNNIHGPDPTNFDCVPYMLGICNYGESEMRLIVALEGMHPDLHANAYKALQFMNKVSEFCIRFDAETIKLVLDKMDAYLKVVILDTTNATATTKSYPCGTNTTAAAATVIGLELERLGRMLEQKWTQMRKKQNELSKISHKDQVNNMDASLPGICEGLLQIFKATMDHQTGCEEKSMAMLGPLRQRLSAVLEKALRPVIERCHLKLSTDPVGVQQMGMYMEEFPGLIHFMFVNKTTGRIVEPELAMGQKPIIDKPTIRKYVRLAQKYRGKGYMNHLWKSASYCFSYFMWHEDANGQYVSVNSSSNGRMNSSKVNNGKETNAGGGGGGVGATTTISPAAATWTDTGNTYNSLIEELKYSQPNYYQKFTDAFFAKHTTVTSYELYLFHLAFVSPGCALEHCRRIAATINDIWGGDACHRDLL